VVSAGKIKTSLEGTNFEITSESAVIQVEIPVI
jgi:hypothetical protein